MSRLSLPKSKPRVLIVEDDLDSAEGFALVLERAGYQTNTVSTASAVLEVLSRSRPTVMLLDLTLQDVGGATLVNTLRQAEPLPPMVVISAAPERVLRSAAQELHAQGALRKPFSSETLLLAVERAAEAETSSPR